MATITKEFLQRKMSAGDSVTFTRDTARNKVTINVKNPVVGTSFSVANTTVLGTAKNVTKMSGNQLFFAQGAVFGGTAAAAGLVTRGICGVTTPGSDGSCSKDSLYLNYDGDNNYSRKVVLGAGTLGTDYGSGMYAYTAVRGDQLKAYVEAQGFAKASAVTANANAIKNIEDNYAKKSYVDNNFAGATATEQAITQLNEATGNNASAIDNIKKSLAGMNSFDYVVTSLPLPQADATTMYKIYLIKDDHTDSDDSFDEYITVEPTSGTYQWEKIGNTDIDLTPYAKTADVDNGLAQKQDTLTAGNGINIDGITNKISVDDGVFATNEYVDENYVSQQIYEQDKDGIEHNVASLGSRMTTAETAIADRYTKGEVDTKVDDKMRYMQTVAKWAFAGNGQYKYCKIATIKLVGAYSNKPIIFECTGRGFQYVQTISIYPIVWDDVTSNYQFLIYRATDDMNWGIKDEGNGQCSLYCELSEVWGNVVVNRVYGDGVRYHTVTMTMTGAAGFPDGTVFASPIIHASKADEATHATNAGEADYSTLFHMKNIGSFNENVLKTLFGGVNSSAWSGASQVVVPYITYGQGLNKDLGMIGECGSGVAWWTGGDMGGAISTSKGDSSIGKSATIANYRGNSLDWYRYLVLSDKSSNIADQTVRSFTATEIGHGDKFDGDLSSTTLLYAPKACTIGGLQPSTTNDPYYQNTITGARDVRFGSATFNLNFSRNAFIDYYLDHGYHFDEETEASTYYRDTGLLCYNGKMYFCAFKYYSNTNTTDFDASPVLTEADGNAKYLPIDGAEATGFNISDREILVGSSKYVQTLQNKAGTIALKSDIPPVPSAVDNLSSSSSTNPLSANQGRILNNKIVAVADTVSCKIAAGLCTVAEDKEYAVTVSGNVISAVATVYRTDNLAGSGNYNERVVVRWSGKTAYIRNDGGQIQISYAVFYAK